MRNRRKTAGKKGFSSVVGAVFMVLIMMVLASSYFVYSLSQNNVYNNAVAQKNQLNVDRLSESAEVLNTTYTPYTDGKVTVYAQIKNIGASSIQFLTVWLRVYNASWTNYKHSNLTDANVQGGSTYTLDLNLTVTGVNSSFTYTFASWLITARGNVVPLQQTIVSANNIIVAQVSQGIGSVAMDFNAFVYYHVDSFNSSYYTMRQSDWPNGSSAFYPPSTGNIAFCVTLTDYDPQNRTIVLSSHTALWMIFKTGNPQQPRSSWWQIVDVAGNGLITSRDATSFTNITLSWGTPTKVYFASSADVVADNQMTPTSLYTSGCASVNLMLFGTIGTSRYGQNIPFVSIYGT